VSTDICWSHVLRFFRHPRTVVDPTPFVDDSQRRLTRASEAPRRLDLHQDSGFRALHGRDPPGL
jgi:hypothetical protein